MRKMDSMYFWTVQPRKVLDTLKKQYLYVPTLSASISKFSEEIQNDTDYIEQYKLLFEWATYCQYRRLGLIDSDGCFYEDETEVISKMCYAATDEISQTALNDLTMIFTFADVIDSPLTPGTKTFRDMNFEEFKNFIAKHLFSIDSLWQGLDPDSVVMKIKASANDYVTVDLNVWQFLMPPTTILPPFTVQDPEIFKSTMLQNWTILDGPMPSEIYQVTLPFLTEDMVVETHEMISYNEIKSLSQTKYPHAQMEIIEHMLKKNGSQCVGFADTFGDDE